MLRRTIKTVSRAKISDMRKHGLKRDADLYEYARNLGLNVWRNLRTKPPSYIAGQPRHVSMGVRTDPYLTRWFSLTSHSLRSSCAHSQSFPRIRLPSHLLENIKASRVGFWTCDLELIRQSNKQPSASIAPFSGDAGHVADVQHPAKRLRAKAARCLVVLAERQSACFTVGATQATTRAVRLEAVIDDTAARITPLSPTVRRMNAGLALLEKSNVSTR